MFKTVLSGSLIQNLLIGNNMKQNGFTLIELMITVAIVAILASIAMPSYENYTRRANRSDGLDTIHNILIAQERYYADNMEYASNLVKLGSATNSMTTPRGHYSISIRQCTGMGFGQCAEIVATANGSQAKDGNLVFNTAGKQVRVLGGTEIDI